ncbi:hypothetical protein ACA910_011248 [Epithemia clementina (nom. ined.)]
MARKIICILLLCLLCALFTSAFRVGMEMSNNAQAVMSRAATNLGSKKSSKLRASLQFKNVEQMLENFGDEPVLIVFTATNCGPCRLQRKELSTVKKDFPLTMVAIDTDRWPHVGSRFHVGKLPCLIALRQGEVLLRLEGLRTADDIISNMRTLV